MADMDRYLRALHAMQAGVAMKLNYDPTDTTPKHLRVGVNAAMSDLSSLAKLLIGKGVITLAEYERAIADGAEEEAKRYEAWLTEYLGGKTKVTLV